MTSNLGVGRPLGFRTHQAEVADLPEALRQVFTPEFVNRIDEVVVFRALEKDDLGKIARLLMDELGERLLEKGLHLEATDEAIDALVERSCDERSGARPLRRGIERLVEETLGRLILSGEAQPGQTYLLEMREGEFVIARKEERPAGAPISREYPRPN
jgi:ATP-dependent Clp protease ATP-binding subunit ClpA